jgi:KipI family sensor histidine kinase inhibitor
MNEARFLDAGETALVVEFGDKVDPAIHDRVLALDAGLTARALPGVREIVPTYRSLIVHYDPLTLDRARLIETVDEIQESSHANRIDPDRWVIPCCYDEAFGEDLASLAEQTKLSRQRVVTLHSGADYRVYMYGFAPGFCYLGGLPKELAVSRRVQPRPPHPPNTILVGGGLTLISTFSMPTGWWLIGRTPERMFLPAREPPFLVKVGDALRFEPISRLEFDALEARATAGETVARKTSS